MIPFIVFTTRPIAPQRDLPPSAGEGAGCFPSFCFPLRYALALKQAQGCFIFFLLGLAVRHSAHPACACTVVGGWGTTARPGLAQNAGYFSFCSVMLLALSSDHLRPLSRLCTAPHKRRLSFVSFPAFAMKQAQGCLRAPHSPTGLGAECPSETRICVRARKQQNDLQDHHPHPLPRGVSRHTRHLNYWPGDGK